MLAWTHAPSGERGISFARERDGWDFWSYARLAERAARSAGGLAGAGVRRGAVVAVVAPTGPELVGLLFGAMLAGATPCLVPPPPAFPGAAAFGAHATALLRAAAPALVACPDDLAGEVRRLAAGAGPVVTAGELARAAPVAATHPGALAPTALLQFTAGSGGRARGVWISWEALDANIAAIRRWLRMTPRDATASWLPVHHDMGLIGCLLTPLATGGDLWLLPPEAFVRRPLRYLRCFGEHGARLSALPAFGLEHILLRVAPADLEGLDFSAWRAVIVGAERVDAGVLERFAALCAPSGLDRRALLPAYGLAEATLAVTGLPLDEPWTAVRTGPVVPGRPVRLRAEGEVVTGCGRPLDGLSVEIVGPAGEPLPEGVAGEIAVRGASLARGYLHAPGEGAPTVFEDDRLRTGDAGFVLDGQLFVLGRLGDSVKVRGRALFAEALEAELAAAGVPAHRAAAALGTRGGRATALAVLERPGPGQVAEVERRLRRAAEGAEVVVLAAARGTVPRTPSGKPRRRELWAAFVAGDLDAATPA